MIPKNLFALDLGTTKFCLARLKQDSAQSLPFIETVSVEAQGMHRGMLADMTAASTALNELLEKAETFYDCDIRKVVVGVAGSHLAGKVASAKMRISTPIVGPALLTEIKDQVICDNREALREIIHCLPLHYRLDDREWIKSPAGFSGEFLYGQFFMMEADKNYLTDLIQLCNQAGLEVQRLIAEPFASATVTSDSESKKLGIAIADIGGGTTDGIIFRDDMPIGAFTINIGGKLMTKDLCIGLALPYAEAEKVKRHFGLQTIARDTRETIEVQDVHGKIKHVSHKDVYPILAARIDELGQLIAKETAPYSNLGSGLLLTGGGSEVKSICPFLRKSGSFDKMLVGKISPKLPKNLQKDLHINILNSDVPAEQLAEQKHLANKYATVSGLLYLELLEQMRERKTTKSSWISQHINQFVDWLKELS